MEKLTLEELKVLESMRKSLRELQKKDLEEVIDFSEELKKKSWQCPCQLSFFAAK